MRPDKETVQRLYETERQSTRQIAAIYGVSGTEVKRWLKRYQITARPASNGLRYRGITEPTKEQLQHWVHVEHLSYKQIGAMFGVDNTAIPHWLKKHGIQGAKVWDTRRKGKNPTPPTTEELMALYSQGHSLAAIGRMYGLSEEPIRRLCTQYGIEARPDGWDGGKRFSCQDGHQARSLYEQRVDDWLHTHGLHHSIEPRLPFNRLYRADFLLENGWYIEIWGVTQNAAYLQRKERKVKLYREYGLPLIELYPHFFATGRNALWERRLKQCLTPVVTPSLFSS